MADHWTPSSPGLKMLIDRLQGVEVNGVGTIRALCPLHDDTHPSLSMTVKRNVDGRLSLFVYCWTCGPVYRRLFPHLGLRASDVERGLCLVDAGPGFSQRGQSVRTVRRLDEFWREAVDRAAEDLLESTSALRYLVEERGLSLDIIKSHSLGLMAGCIRVPVFVDGGLVNVRDYRLDRSHPKWRGRYKVPVTLFPDPSQLLQRRSVVLVEGEFDALLARDRGLPAWTTTGGALGFSSDWKTYFRTVQIAYIIYDCDEAGEVGAISTARILGTWGIKTKIIDLGLEDGQDIGTYFLEYGKNIADLRSIVRQTSWTRS